MWIQGIKYILMDPIWSGATKLTRDMTHYDMKVMQPKNPMQCYIDTQKKKKKNSEYQPIAVSDTNFRPLI
jgi:hypothetical protein